jgi:hypothetical protein
MKYLKRFENFDLGRFSREEDEENAWLDKIDDMSDNFDDEEILPGDIGSLEDDEDDFYEDDEDSDLDDEREMRRRVWGDEVVEKKKVNAGLQAYLDKQKSKKGDKKEEKGDKKEPMKKAAKDAILKKQK